MNIRKMEAWRFLPLSLLVFVAPIVGQAADKPCDCRIFPFEPERCARICTGQILKAAKPQNLSTLLGISLDLAKRVNQLAKTTEDAQVLKQLKGTLNPTEFAAVQKGLDNLDEAQVRAYQETNEIRL